MYGQCALERIVREMGLSFVLDYLFHNYTRGHVAWQSGQPVLCAWLLRAPTPMCFDHDTPTRAVSIEV